MKVRYLPVSPSVGAAASVALLFLVVAGGCASGPGVGSPAPTSDALIDAHLDAVENSLRGIR